MGFRKTHIQTSLTSIPTTNSARLGLLANWQQFTLLVIVNAFVGAMVGLERTVVPLIAESDFGLTSKSLTLSFIVSFGIVKALANLFAGRFSDRIGRKQILVAGWLFALPVPFLIIFAQSWGWIVLANLLLGVNQGLCWSTTVIMKIDLVGPKQRGLAMGLNEFAGYLALSLSALATGYLAATYGLRPVPFLPGIVFALSGLILSNFFIRETHSHAQHEAQTSVPPLASSSSSQTPTFREIFLLTSWMWVQSVGIAFFVVGSGFWAWLIGAVLLGIGTAMVYPALLAAVSDVAHPSWRASAVGVYRLWRDAGYAVGALLAGVLADALGIPFAVSAIAALTLLSGMIVAVVMYETLAERKS